MEAQVIYLGRGQMAPEMDVIVVAAEIGGWSVLDFDETEDVIWSIAERVSSLDRAIDLAKARAAERELKTIYVEGHGTDAQGS